MDQRQRTKNTAAIYRRTIRLNGKRTSVSLEDEFWQALREIASRKNMTASALVEQIDLERNTVNLSSAVRLFVIDYYSSVSTLRSGPSLAH